jgi:hypothetical protein
MERDGKGANPGKGVRPMQHKGSFGMSAACSAALLLVTVSFGAQTAAAATTGKERRAAPIVHRARRLAADDRRQAFAPPPTLPYGPRYGFLRAVPPNAIRMPGYTFVPGVGILGESCDLPTSACPNEYRDIQ